MGDGEYRDYTSDYRESDVEVLYRRGDWKTWQEAIRWLETGGMDDDELTPGEVNHMAADLGDLASAGKPFTKDPHQAYEMAREICRHQTGRG